MKKRYMEGIDFVFENTPQLSKIGSKEEYEKYIRNIFPQTKIKNIAYHDSPNADIKEFIKNNKGIFSTGDINWWQKEKYKYALVLKIENPKIIQTPLNSAYTEEFISNKENEKYDALVTTGTKGKLEEGVYVVREPEQIHILGSEKDIEGFKEYVSKKKDSLESRVVSSVFIAIFIFSLFLISSNITGNVIGNMTKAGSNFFGILLFLSSVYGFFVYRKLRRK